MEQAGNTYLNNSSELSYVHSNTVLPDTATASELWFVFITGTASLACAFLRRLQQQEHKEKQDPTEWYQHKSRLLTFTFEQHMCPSTQKQKNNASAAYRHARTHQQRHRHGQDSLTEPVNSTTTQTYRTLAQCLSSRQSHRQVQHCPIRASSECKHTRIHSPSRRQQHTVIGIPNLSLNESKTGTATTVCTISQQSINNRSGKQCYD